MLCIKSDQVQKVRPVRPHRRFHKVLEALFSVCVVGILLPGFSTVLAQIPVASRTNPVWSELSPVKVSWYESGLSRLNQHISLHLDNATLEEAFEEIKRKSRVDVGYGKYPVLAEKRVTLKANQITVLDALHIIVRGSNLGLRMAPSGRVLVIPRPEPAEEGTSANTTPSLLPAHDVSGRVTSLDDGMPLPGVNVVVKGTMVGTATDTEGRYSLSAPNPTDTLVFSFVGYQTLEVAIEGRSTIDVEMSADVAGLEELIVVGYGARRKETLTGSVSAVTGDILEKAPVINTSNTLAGKLPGIVSVTSSGEPGYDGSTIRIRGNHTLNNNNPLVVIDGVPNRAGGLERLSPEDIESISVLKDATAAIYGAQAANGVILVTTKRGRSTKPEVVIDFNQGFNQPTRIPEMADAATYLTMLNEIEIYRGREPIYSEEEIQKYRNGADPWFYPDTDWFSEALKPVSLQSRGHVRLTGGTNNLRYFLSLGGLTEDGYYRNSATRYNQYNFRSNIDGQISENITVRFDVTGRLEDRNFPTQSAYNTFRMLMRSKPNLPAHWPNGMPGPDIEYGQNPVVTGTDVTGYNNDERYYLQSNLALEVKLPWVKGLSVRGNASYDKQFRAQKRWEKPWTLYTWDYKTYDEETGEPLLVPGQRGYSEPRLYRRHEDGKNILLNLITEYRADLGLHSVGVLLGIERQKFDNTFFDAYRRFFISEQVDELFAGGEDERDNNGSTGHGARQNYFTRLNYNYQGKYLFEFVGRYDGSYIFPENKRYGFFPAISAGWRISQEPFFRNNVGLFQNLKLRASWGQTGNDRIDEWQYLSTFGFGSGYVIGPNNEKKSLYQTRTPNPDVTWEVANQFDIGLEGDLLDGQISFEFDYFDYLRSDILHFRNASVPEFTGLTLPRENIGEVASWGYDGSVTWRQMLRNDVSYEITFAGGYAKNRIQFWDETPGAPEWQRSTGHPMSTGLYYKAIGVFETEEDVEAYPHWNGARPGDIIFEDLDGDGEITADDRIRIDKNDTPTFTGGITLGARIKQFDLNVFFQGATGAVQYIYTESGDLGNYFADFARNRWTPENPNSEHPRTFNGNEEYWRAQNNTYFLRDTDYIRLKTVQLGYTLPESLSNRIGLNNLRLYVSGFNLFTWDKLKLMDPEARDDGGAYYLQKRVFNAGVSLTL